ncbi:MAG: IS3 family transposase [Butyricicoccaceae bacterium]
MKTRADTATGGLRQCCTAEGSFVNHKTVRRLMKVLGMICRVRMKKYRSWQGKCGQNCTKSVKSGFLCRQAEPEVGYGCD